MILITQDSVSGLKASMKSSSHLPWPRETTAGLLLSSEPLSAPSSSGHRITAPKPQQKLPHRGCPERAKLAEALSPAPRLGSNREDLAAVTVVWVVPLAADVRTGRAGFRTNEYGYATFKLLVGSRS